MLFQGDFPDPDESNGPLVKDPRQPGVTYGQGSCYDMIRANFEDGRGMMMMMLVDAQLHIECTNAHGSYLASKEEIGAGNSDSVFRPLEEVGRL